MIIITGASRGIGRYLFTHFKNEGIKVIGTYNSTLEGFDSDLDFYYKVNIIDYKSVESWIATLKDVLTEIILINCAGISYNSFAHKADLEQWGNVIDVNLKGSFNVIRFLLPIMREQNYGRIVNFSSVAAQIGTSGVSAYAASKSALWGLSRSIAVENASKGITINNINLGYANVGMGVEKVPEEYQNLMKLKIPSRQFCNPDDILKTVKYIISTEYLNGASIDLNGGLI